MVRVRVRVRARARVRIRIRVRVRVRVAVGVGVRVGAGPRQYRLLPPLLLGLLLLFCLGRGSRRRPLRGRLFLLLLLLARIQLLPQLLHLLEQLLLGLLVVARREHQYIALAIVGPQLLAIRRSVEFVTVDALDEQLVRVRVRVSGQGWGQGQGQG